MLYWSHWDGWNMTADFSSTFFSWTPYSLQELDKFPFKFYDRKFTGSFHLNDLAFQLKNYLYIYIDITQTSHTERLIKTPQVARRYLARTKHVYIIFK